MDEIMQFLLEDEDVGGVSPPMPPSPSPSLPAPSPPDPPAPPSCERPTPRDRGQRRRDFETLLRLARLLEGRL